MTNPVKQDDVALLTIPGAWNINYNYAAGHTASRFFASLRDEETIEATVCPSCERALIPPRAFCDRCFCECDEWRKVGPEGTIISFTVSSIRSAGLNMDPPFMIAMIRLDGADTNLIHLVEGLDLADPEKLLEQVKQGLRVRAEFKPREQRTGHILDIRAFQPI